MIMGHLLAWSVGIWEILIILLVVLLLFGANKIPQLMRGMGQGINEFKKGLKDGESEGTKPPETPGKP